MPYASGRVIHDDKEDHYGVITVHEALEHSSDVAAVKLALKVGPDNFYHYMREFGFGAQWAGQGAPLARAMPAAKLVATLAAELNQA